MPDKKSVKEVLDMWLESTKHDYALVGKFELAYSYGWNDSKVKGCVGDNEYNLQPYTSPIAIDGYNSAFLKNDTEAKFVLVQIGAEYYLISQK